MQENATTPIKLSLSGWFTVCGNAPRLAWRRKISLTWRDAPELQTMHLYHRILSRGPACRGRGLVCSSLQSAATPAVLQPDTAWCHCGHVDMSQTPQTDVMRPVLLSCRHLHDFMQTEHYTGINYCYKNNQVRRAIRNWGPSSCIRHQVYIPNQCSR